MNASFVGTRRAGQSWGGHRQILVHDEAGGLGFIDCGHGAGLGRI
jgi:hypothetical protein